jgi:hypothetical protein
MFLRQIERFAADVLPDLRAPRRDQGAGGVSE